MRLLLNHSIAGAADLIALIRRTRPDIHVTVTHERKDTPITIEADLLLPEPPQTRDMSAQDYAAWLLGIALAHDADLILPYRRREELAGFREKFSAQRIRLLTAADPEVMRFLEEKPSLLSKMDAAGVPIIPFRLFMGSDAYAVLRAEGDLFSDHPGPLCVKPASGIYGAGFRIIRDTLPVRATLSGLSTLELPDVAFRALLGALPAPEPMMLMPYLRGVERSVDFACYEGRLLGSVTRVKTSTSQLLCHDPYGEELAGLIAQIFQLTGVLNLQTMEDESGTQRLMEVNTRASGGIGMTGLTDVNLPDLLLRALDGEMLGTPARVSGEVRVGRRDLYWQV